jgi:Ca2+-transporting ATPase
MGIDTLVQGVVISALTLVSYFIGVHYAEAGSEPALVGMTMAFLTLSMVEMFHSLNMRSRRGSIFTLPTQNVWAWGAFGLSLVLTYIVIETPLSNLFNFAELDMAHYGIAMGLAISIIPIIEIYKAIMRGIEKE